MDRSAAYMGRYVAKNIVAAGLATRCRNPVRLRHRLSRSRVSVCVNTFGTGSGAATSRSPRRSAQVFSFKPADIIKQLNLLRPIYAKTTNYGHFGKDDPDLTWERTDKVAALKKAVQVTERVEPRS